MTYRPHAPWTSLLGAALASAAAFAPAAWAAAGPPTLVDVQGRVIAQAAHGRPPVVVFGLDGCLLDPAPRTRDILERALEGPGAVVAPEQPELAARVRTAPPGPYAFEPESTLARAGIVDTAMVRALRVRWEQDFGSNRFLADDEALTGAVAFVQALYAQGCTVVYVSGRDVRRMLAGTAQSLVERGFPVGVVRTQLLLKPDRRADDLVSLGDALTAAGSLGEVVAVFDADPRTLDLARARLPQALRFLVGRTLRAGAARLPPPGVTRLTDFSP